MLLALICPISMVAMMVGMGMSKSGRQPAGTTAGQETLAASRERHLQQLLIEHGRTQAEIDKLERELGERSSAAQPAS